MALNDLNPFSMQHTRSCREQCNANMPRLGNVSMTLGDRAANTSDGLVLSWSEECKSAAGLPRRSRPVSRNRRNRRGAWFSCAADVTHRRLHSNGLKRLNRCASLQYVLPTMICCSSAQF